MKLLRAILNRPVLSSAFVLSVGYLLMLGWRISPSGLGFPGSESYSDIALQLVNEGRYNTAFRPPLYPLFLAVCMSAFGEAWEVGAMFFQGVAAVGLGTLFVAAVIRLNGSAGAGITALLLLLSNILFQFEIMAKRETTLFTLLAILFFVAPLFITRLRSRYLLMSITAALAFLLRPNAIALIPVFIGIAFLDRKRADFSWKLLIMPAVFFVLTILPWQLFVYQQSGSFPFTTSTNSGQTLWKGNNPYLLDVWPKLDIDAIEGEMSRGIGGQNIKLEAADRELKTQAVQFIKDNPVLTLRNAAIKALVFFSPLTVPWASGQVEVHDGKTKLTKVRKRSSFILGFSTLQSLLVWIGWIGFVLNCRSSETKKQLAVASVLFTVLLLGIHTITYPESRYRWPLDIFLTMLSADYLFSRISRFFSAKA
jgi:hypothetical protein